MRRLAVAVLPVGLIFGFWLADPPVTPTIAPPPPAVVASLPRPAATPKPAGNETISGRAVGLRGEGIAGIHVSASTQDGEPMAETRTGENGAFNVPGLPRGLYRLEVTGAEILPAELGRIGAPAAQVTIVVSRAVAIAGKVTDSGVPAAGATLEVSGATLDVPRQAEIGPDGSFRIDGLPEGQFVVAARRGRRAALAAGVERTGVGPWPEVELALAPAARVSVAVTGDAGPIAGAWVILFREDLVRRAATDARGVARFEGVASGAGTLDIVAEGFLPAARRPLAIEVEDDLSLDVALARGLTLVGRVTDAGGVPVAGAVIELAGEGTTVSAVSRAQRLAWAAGKRLSASRRLLPIGELGVLPGPIPLPPPPGAVWALPADDDAEPTGFRTAADGTFRIENLPAGRFRVRAAHPDFAFAETEPLAPGQSAAVVLRRGGEIAGRVTDDRGLALPAAQLSLVEAGRDVAVTFVDKDGRYRFAHVLGEVTVRAAAPGFAAVEKNVHPEEGAHVDLPLALPAATGAGSGRVLDPDGRPVAGADVVASGPGGVKISARTDATGNFRLTGVGGGSWRVAASHGDFPAVEAPLGDEPVELVLQRGGGITGELRDAVTRGPILRFTIFAESPGGQTLRRSFEKGSFSLAPLAAGTWRLSVEARGFATRVVDVEVRAGDVQTGVWLDMQVGATVGGTVYDEHGEAVSGATVTCGLVSTTTDRLGSFKLRGVYPGDVPVVVSHPTAGAGQLVVPLRSGDDLSTLEIRVAR